MENCAFTTLYKDVNMDGTGGYYAEWNESIGEGQTLYVLIHLGNINNSERE